MVQGNNQISRNLLRYR